MFNVGMTELLLILVIAFVVVGPKDLPKVARALGRFVRYVRQMVEEVKRESGFDEVAGELKDIEGELKQDLKSADVRKDLRKAEADLRGELNAAKAELKDKKTGSAHKGA